MIEQEVLDLIGKISGGENLKFTSSDLAGHAPKLSTTQVGNALVHLADKGLVYRTYDTAENGTRGYVWANYIPARGVRPAKKLKATRVEQKKVTNVEEMLSGDFFKSLRQLELYATNIGRIKNNLSKAIKCLQNINMALGGDSDN